MSGPLYVTASLQSKPAHENDLRRLLMAAAPAFQKEDGCLSYTLLENAALPGSFFTYEMWSDQSALDQHMKSPKMNELKPKLKDLLSHEMKQELFKMLVPE